MKTKETFTQTVKHLTKKAQKGFQGGRQATWLSTQPFMDGLNKAHRFLPLLPPLVIGNDTYPDVVNFVANKIDDDDTEVLDLTLNFCPGMEVSVPITDAEATRRKKEGLCPKCGEKGKFVNLQAVCSKHGPY